MKDKSIKLLLLLYAIITFLCILLFDGTGDAGDSIYHYQFAKFAPLHPSLFFDHWAKPVYVLLACPFAQFGFVGIKIFNAIASILSVFFTFKIAQKLELENSIVGAIILICCPLSFVLTFSGLTEPLFALFLSISIYKILDEKYFSACILSSFLPFIRSEGLIFICIFACYFLVKKEWKILPLLLFGHLVYSIAGYFVYYDFFWIFNKIPYARLNSIYGNGSLFHFVEQLIYVIGIPIYILFWIGIINIIWKSIKKEMNAEIQILIFLGFLSFFVAHTLFWYFGIFNSMGLKRVFVGIAPLIAIIALIGFNFITKTILKTYEKPQLIAHSLLIIYIFIFPFTPNPAAIHYERDLSLLKDQEVAKEMVEFITQNIGLQHRFVVAHPYLSELLKIDPFNPSQRLELNENFMNQVKSGDIVIWENWFAVIEHDITKESLDKNPELIGLHDIRLVHNGYEMAYSLYRKK